ncbi:MAG: diguanylate cyclase [Ruminiclostridium sp.]|nr:diguanylate cyclase [Ruminiclostridium sp.]
MKIKSLLIIVLACFVIIPSVVFASVANVEMNKLALKNYKQTAQSMTENQTYNISEYFRIISASAKQIADNPDILEFNSEKNPTSTDALDIYSAIASSDNENVRIDRIMIVNKSDYLPVVSTGDLSGISKDDTLSNTLKSICSKNDGEVTFYTSDVYTTFKDGDKEHKDPLPAKSNDSLRLVVKYAVGDYYVVTFFNDTALRSFATSSQFANNSKLILIDPNGSILHGSYMGNTSDAKNSAYLKFTENAQVGSVVEVDNFKGTENGAIPTIGFTSKMATINEGEDGNWTLAIIAETDKAYTLSGEAMGSIIGIIVFVSIVLVAAAVVLVFIITKPIKVIEETLVKVHRGDHEARINVIANNEYGQIARTFNDLIDDIVVSEGRYRTIIEMSDNIIFEWNFKTNDVIFSNNFNKKFSYRAPSDHFGDSFLLKVKVHPEDNERYHKDLEKLSKGEEFAGNEYRWKNIYGDYIWILMRTATIRDRDGNIAKIVGVIVDIDRAKKSEKLLTERASYDSLTGLYNRESIERTIDNEIELINVRKSEFAILFIDVDDFKIYNDKYSHATGDQVLKFVANTINFVIKGFGTAGRYGGDEFVACVRNVETNDPTRVARDILSGLKEGFTSDNGDKLTVNASIGISIIKDSSMHVDEIIGMADDAMYKIKKNGKSNFGILNKETVAKPVPAEVEEEDVIGTAEETTASAEEDTQSDAPVQE